jgi:hypothetical protein
MDHFHSNGLEMQASKFEIALVRDRTTPYAATKIPNALEPPSRSIEQKYGEWGNTLYRYPELLVSTKWMT